MKVSSQRTSLLSGRLESHHLCMELFDLALFFFSCLFIRCRFRSLLPPSCHYIQEYTPALRWQWGQFFPKPGLLLVLGVAGRLGILVANLVIPQFELWLFEFEQQLQYVVHLVYGYLPFPFSCFAYHTNPGIDAGHKSKLQQAEQPSFKFACTEQVFAAGPLVHR